MLVYDNNQPGRQPSANATEGAEPSGHGVSEQRAGGQCSVSSWQQSARLSARGGDHSRGQTSVQFNATVVDDNIINAINW